MHAPSLPTPARWAALLAVLATAAPCLAQALADPTRPAAAWLAAQPRPPGAPAADETSSHGVQITVTGPTRRFAIVDGYAVRVGETHNGAKLVAINQDGVVWQRGGVQEKSATSPAVQKIPSSTLGSTMRAERNSRKTVNGEGK